MYRLIKPLPYEWSFVRDNATINPYFTLDDKGKIHLVFIDLLDEQGNSFGIWIRHNIDVHLMAHICREIQAHERDWEYLDSAQIFGMNWEVIE